MRTALVLLFLLALAAVPGSVVPQRDIDAVKVANWKAAHTTLTPVYDKLGLFHVYGSAWFSAIYILLMVSLVGCVVPRLRITGVRCGPGRPGRRAGCPGCPSPAPRLDEEPDAVLERARDGAAPAPLPGGPARRGRRRGEGLPAGGRQPAVPPLGPGGPRRLRLRPAVRLQGRRDHHRRPGLQQHPEPVRRLRARLALRPLGPVAVQLLRRRLPREVADQRPGDGPAGVLRRERHLPQQPGRGAAEARPGGQPPAEHRGHRRVPGRPRLRAGGHGPRRQGQGRLQGPAVFLPQDSSFARSGWSRPPTRSRSSSASRGCSCRRTATPAPRARSRSSPTTSTRCCPWSPYHGDLGLDGGKPQSVYTLAKSSRLKTFPNSDPKLGPVKRIKLEVGQTVKIPDGLGSIRFDGVQRFVKLQVSHSPGKGVALGGVMIGILGLMGSLFIRPRRAWVRVPGARTGVPWSSWPDSTAAGGDLATEVDEIERLVRNAPDHQPEPADRPAPRGSTREHRGLRRLQRQRHHVRLDRLRPGVPGAPHRVGVPALAAGARRDRRRPRAGRPSAVARPRRSRTAVPSPTTRWRRRSCGWRSGAASGSR